MGAALPRFRQVDLGIQHPTLWRKSWLRKLSSPQASIAPGDCGLRVAESLWSGRNGEVSNPRRVWSWVWFHTTWARQLFTFVFSQSTFHLEHSDLWPKRKQNNNDSYFQISPRLHGQISHELCTSIEASLFPIGNEIGLDVQHLNVCTLHADTPSPIAPSTQIGAGVATTSFSSI